MLFVGCPTESIYAWWRALRKTRSLSSIPLLPGAQSSFCAGRLAWSNRRQRPRVRISTEPWRRTGRLTTHLRRLVRELKKELWVEVTPLFSLRAIDALRASP